MCEGRGYRFLSGTGFWFAVSGLASYLRFSQLPYRIVQGLGMPAKSILKLGGSHNIANGHYHDHGNDDT